MWAGGNLSAMFRIVGDEPGFMEIPGLPEGVPVRDIHGTGPNDIWAVAGGFSPELGFQLTFVSHFDGQSWSAVESIPTITSDPIWRVWALAPNDVWLRIGPALISVRRRTSRPGFRILALRRPDLVAVPRRPADSRRHLDVRRRARHPVPGAADQQFLVRPKRHLVGQPVGALAAASALIPDRRNFRWVWP